MNPQPLRIGVAGLGRAFTLMLPTFVQDRRVRLVAATDPLPQARAQFERDFGAPTVGSVAALCQRPEVQVIYIATPHELHAEHVALAAAAGKHILVEKPMAITVADCSRMIEAAQRAGVQLIVGHSHSFNAPVRLARQLIDSGQYGAVRMISALNFTDFLYRPRRPQELDTAQGGGVIHSQAAHQIDIVRLLGGGWVESVQAQVGAWDAARPTEGAYSALLRFAGGAFASASYSGYGHFDSDVWMDGRGELGQLKTPQDYGAARQRLGHVAGAAEEEKLKAARNYGGHLYAAAGNAPPERSHQHFGPLIVSCDGADLQVMPHGVWIHGHTAQRLETLAPPTIARQEVIDELCAAVQQGTPPTHSGAWARATTAVCLAILESATHQQAVAPPHQVAYAPPCPNPAA